MDLHDALAELGVARGASQDEIRKAYLRLLKTRKPEIDPEGFMRLREAYDLAKRLGSLSFVEFDDAHADALSDDAPPNFESAPGAPPEPSAPRELHVARRGAPKAARERKAPADGESDVRLPAPRIQHVRAQIFAPQVFRDDWPLPGAPLDAWIARIGAAEAADRLTTALDGATTSAVSLPFAPTLPIDAALAFFVEQQKPLATRVVDQFGTWLKTTGGELRIARGPSGVIWNVARELDAIAPEVSSGVLAALARAARIGAPGSALEPLRQCVADDRHAIDTAAAVISRSAPTLQSLFGTLFDSVRGVRASASPQRGSSKNGWWGAWLAAMMFSALARNFTGSDPGAGSSAPPPTTPAIIEPSGPPLPRNSPFLAESGDYHAAINAIVADTQSTGGTEVVREALQLEDAIGLGQCVQVREHRAALQRALDAFRVSSAWRHRGDLHGVDAAIERRCQSGHVVPTGDGSAP